MQCYIAKKRLDRAIELYRKVIPDGKHDIFHISWHAYYLANNRSSPAVLTGAISPILARTANCNPSPDVQEGEPAVVCDVKTGTCAVGNSIPVQEAITRRFGGSTSTAEAMKSRLQAKGQIDGIKFSFGNRIGSSRDAHRLIYLAGQHDMQDSGQPQKPEDNLSSSDGCSRQNKVVEGLFKRYFEEDGDITSHEMLFEIAQTAGLDGDLVKKWLDSDEGGDVVDREAEAAVTKHGITGVPVLFINETVRIDGAQDVEDFFMEFVKIKDAGAGVVQG